MPRFYIENDPNLHGECEVHREYCKVLLSAQNVKYIGLFDGCQAALVAARMIHPKAIGCLSCSGECRSTTGVRTSKRN